MPCMSDYPLAMHLEGSRMQPDVRATAALPIARLDGHRVVVEEKLDGAGVTVACDPAGELVLVARGQPLAGDRDSEHFSPLIEWATSLQPALHAILGVRYILFGEWLNAKHTIFYDDLPDYFIAHDVLDRAGEVFLSTERRHQLLSGLSVFSATVLWQGTVSADTRLDLLLGASRYKRADWRERLTRVAAARGLDEREVKGGTDPSDDMEGLYIRSEAGGCVTGRYQLIRPTFHDAVAEAGDEWYSRPILPNLRRGG